MKRDKRQGASKEKRENGGETERETERERGG